MTVLKPNISVVVPVYNVERYLTRCLDSIFNQHFSGTFEVIAVEDASTDNSLQLLKHYQEKEPRLKIIKHGVNKKLSIARATGMKAAAGDYIMHVDSDDWLLPGAFEALYKSCIETNADVVVFNHVRENNEGKRTSVNSIKSQLLTTDKLRVQQHFLGAPWNKIVKRALTGNMISGEVGVNNTEDLLYASEIFLRVESICLMPVDCYIYFVNTESLTWQIKSEDYIQNQVIILNQLQRMVDKYKPGAKCIDTILNYFEKFIYLKFAKIQMLRAGKSKEFVQFIRDVSIFPIMTCSRTTRLENSLDNRFRCLVEVAKRFGVLYPIKKILGSFKIKLTSHFV